MREYISDIFIKIRTSSLLQVDMRVWNHIINLLIDYFDLYLWQYKL